MRISVVIPLYNKKPHVRAAIKSALTQSLAPHEIIVVDDGSSDRGLDVVQSMVDSRVRIFTRSPPGPGGYAARNLGIRHATGDWIAFLDADDLWRPDHLADLAAARQAAGAGDGIGCLFSRFEVKEEARDRLYRVDETVIMPGRPITLAAFLRGWLATERCPMWTSAIAIRRDVLEKAGDFPAGRVRRGGDKDLWLRCMGVTQGAYAPAPSAEFHQDAVNRVTKSAAHVQLPIIIETIRTLERSATLEERGLLRRLRNQEIRLYARHAAGAGAIVGPGFLAALHYPAGLRDAGAIGLYAAAGVIRGRIARRP